VGFEGVRRRKWENIAAMWMSCRDLKTAESWREALSRHLCRDRSSIPTRARSIEKRISASDKHRRKVRLNQDQRVHFEAQVPILESNNGRKITSLIRVGELQYSS